MSQRSTTIKSQAGFTLVELAIVMIIIGLLIGGVLKGQELIGNAQVTATVAQVKALDAATSTFKDTYQSIPGDITNSGTRLPNCTAANFCLTTGTLGDGRLNSTPAAAPGTEAVGFFVQLNAANLLTGIIPGTQTFGGNYPATKISGSGFQAGSSVSGATGDFTNAIGGVAIPINSGLYLTITNTANAASSTATVGLRPTEASRIDAKVDDAVPDTGSVRAYGNAAATGCATATAGAVPGVYQSSNASAQCGLYIQVQS